MSCIEKRPKGVGVPPEWKTTTLGEALKDKKNDPKFMKYMQEYLKKQKSDYAKEIDIKSEIREMNKLFNEVTTSDLQGIATVKAQNIIGKGDLNDKDYRMRLSEAENVILEYANGNMDINSAKRFLLDIKILNNKSDYAKKWQGLSDNLPDKLFDKRQVSRGIPVEFEHTHNKSTAKHIVHDHLFEFGVNKKTGIYDAPYYDELDKMEKKLKGMK
jgi:hypothetical protein